MLAQTEHAVSTAQRADRGEIGQLAIGFVPSADLDILPRVLRVWSARFPAVEINLHPPAAERRRPRRCATGGSRSASCASPSRRAASSSRPSSTSRWWRSCPRVTGWRGAPRVRLSDAARRSDDHVSARARRPDTTISSSSACRRAGFTPHVFHEPGSIQTNLGLVSAGFGVTLMPASIRSLGRAGVVYRPLASARPARRDGHRVPARRTLARPRRVPRRCCARPPPGVRPGPPSPRPRSGSAPRST